MTETDDFLVAAMAYCLCWELGGARTSQHWEAIHEFIADNQALSETERWMCELYEESSPTAQEERSIAARINARIDHPRVVVSFRQSILALIPEALAEVAGKHRLMNTLAVPEGYSLLRTWLVQHKISSRPSQPANSVPLAVREAEFLQFIEHPYFLQGFRSYWHMPPKSRSNIQTRVLLCVSAALSQMVTCDDVAELRLWTGRLAKIGNYTLQTQEDVTDLCMTMSDESYDAQELAYRLFVDAKEVDRVNLTTFCNRYSEDLTGFARELVRGMQITF